MTKTFCDKCGREITKEMRLPESVVIDPVSNDFVKIVKGGVQQDHCLYCFIDAVMALEDREADAGPIPLDNVVRTGTIKLDPAPGDYDFTGMNPHNTTGDV